MNSRWLDDRLAPIASAYSAKPLDYDEVDKHIDGPRIWATIVAIREEALLEIQIAKADTEDRAGVAENALKDYKFRAGVALVILEKDKTAANFAALVAIIKGE